MAQNQHRAFLVAGWKPSLDPCAHPIFMTAEQNGDFLDRVAAVDFDEAVVGVAFSHDGYLPLLAFWIIAHLSSGYLPSRFQLHGQWGETGIRVVLLAGECHLCLGFSHQKVSTDDDKWPYSSFTVR